MIPSLLLLLAPCPNKPNCVNSQAENILHAIPPFPIHQTPEQSIDALASIIRSLPRTQIIEQTPTYLHATFTSRIFHFTDDVEFLYNPTKNVLEVRSASRIGYSDLGVNRKRVETLRALYQKQDINS